MSARPRVIPCLLLRGGGLVKGVRFRRHTYVGDPINAVRIFNDKQVDELAILDIGATAERRSPDLRRIEEICSQAFMPVAYGGGIRTVEQVRDVLRAGVEKIVVNTAAVEDPRFVRDASDRFGSQSVVVSLDVGRTLFGRSRICARCGRRALREAPEAFAEAMQRAGAGELLLNDVDRDGRRCGYDLDLVRRVSSAVDIPVIAAGGAGSVADLRAAIAAGASAAAAGSLFVFHGPHRAVLITYPEPDEVTALAR